MGTTELSISPLSLSAFSFLASVSFSCAFFHVCLIIRLSLISCYYTAACEEKCFEELIQLKSSPMYLVVTGLSVNGTSCFRTMTGMQNRNKQ